MTNPGSMPPSDDERAQISDPVEQVKRLAVRYRALTGKPLGITGGIAECEAAAILWIDLRAARTAGYDATETGDGIAVHL